ncbi:MAG: isoprenyl transferase [Flavobacteriaceae bacterium]|nr:isoprenyl transferase [Flavobacteriaceae bacterium]PHX77122.1 MAG: isoprenyl transferase [Flavobacteriales bacterium]
MSNLLAQYQINPDRVPQHVAIIMDGNGRWAKQKGHMRIFGHRQGVKAVRAAIESAAEIGVGYLTLYAFSTENWTRPEQEVNGLMELLVDTIDSELPTLMKNKIKLATIGDLAKLPKKCQAQLEKTKDKTAENKGLTLVLALSYSGRWDIIEAIKRIGVDVKSGKLTPEEINDEILDKALNTSCFPNPDLLVRTSGEQRISNFLLWEIAYSELYFTPVLWPDFTKDDFYKAIVDYQGRERRFGKTSEQIA